MGTTSSGFTYPEPSDPVADGADAIKALAQQIESMVGVFASGGGSINLPSGGANNGSEAVTFPAGRFGAVPRVVACVQGASFWFATVSAVTTAGCTITVRNMDNNTATGTVAYSWMARS
jgi:hypothetical protein